MADINQILDPKIISELKKINAELIKSGETVDKIIPSFDKLNKASRELGKTSTATGKARKKLTAYQKEAQKITTQLEQVEGKINAQNTKKAKQLQILQERQRQQLQLLKAEAKVKSAAAGSNQKLAATISLYEKRLKTVNQTTAKGRATAEKLRQKIDQMNQKLTQQSSQLTKTKRNIGNYSSALQGMGARVKNAAKQFVGALGLTSVVLGFVTVLKRSVRSITQFGSAQSELAALSGKTTEELKGLTAQAKTLGGITEFTAIQITKLQTELTKLGFTVDEINVSTKAILNFASATGAELPAAAKTAGTAIRVFNLDASKMEDVVSTLAVSTTKSALTFEHFDTILSNAGPVARAFNFSLEDTIALAGKLTDAGFDASKSSTALRNILLSLADSGGALAQELGGSVNSFEELIPALIELRERGVSLNDTLQLTDKRSVAAFNQFLTAAEGADKLRDSISGVNDELDAMVDKKLDNLAGDVTKLSSAWEGLVLNAEGGANAFRTVVQFATDAAVKLANLDLIFTRSSKMSAEQMERTWSVLNAINDKKAKDFRKIVASFSNVEYANLLGSRDEFVERLDAIGFTTLEARRLWEKYKDKRLEQNSQEIAAHLNKGRKIQEQQQKDIQAQEKAEKESAEERRRIHEQFTNDIRELHKELTNDLLLGWYDYTEDFESQWDSFLERWTKKSKTAGEEIRESMRMFPLPEEEEENIDALMAQINEFLGKTEEKEDEKEASKEERRRYAVEQASTLGNTLFDLKNNQLQREFEAAEGNEKKQAELKTKMAKQEKRQALFNIAVNTAQGIMQAIKMFGPPPSPAGIAGIATATALGLVQAGVVAAQPVPEFAKGTEHAPGGHAIVGEKGRELIQTPRGEVYMANNPALVNLERGTKVLSNRKTEAYLNDGNIVTELRQTRKAINKIPQPVFKNGSKIAERRGNYWKNYYKSKYRLN